MAASTTSSLSAFSGIVDTAEHRHGSTRVTLEHRTRALWQSVEFSKTDIEAFASQTPNHVMHMVLDSPSISPANDANITGSDLDIHIRFRRTLAWRSWASRYCQWSYIRRMMTSTEPTAFCADMVQFLRLVTQNPQQLSIELLALAVRLWEFELAVVRGPAITWIMSHCVGDESIDWEHLEILGQTILRTQWCRRLIDTKKSWMLSCQRIYEAHVSAIPDDPLSRIQNAHAMVKSAIWNYETAFVACLGPQHVRLLCLLSSFGPSIIPMALFELAGQSLGDCRDSHSIVQGQEAFESLSAELSALVESPKRLRIVLHDLTPLVKLRHQDDCEIIELHVKLSTVMIATAVGHGVRLSDDSSQNLRGHLQTMALSLACRAFPPDATDEALIASKFKHILLSFTQHPPCLISRALSETFVSRLLSLASIEPPCSAARILVSVERLLEDRRGNEPQVGASSEVKPQRVPEHITLRIALERARLASSNGNYSPSEAILSRYLGPGVREAPDPELQHILGEMRGLHMHNLSQQRQMVVDSDHHSSL